MLVTSVKLDVEKLVDLNTIRLSHFIEFPITFIITPHKYSCTKIIIMTLVIKVSLPQGNRFDSFPTSSSPESQGVVMKQTLHGSLEPRGH